MESPAVSDEESKEPSLIMAKQRKKSSIFKGYKPQNNSQENLE